MIKELREIENAYMELFCQKESFGSIDFFANQILQEMYDHNVTQIKELTSEENMKLGFDFVGEETELFYLE